MRNMKSIMTLKFVLCFRSIFNKKFQTLELLIFLCIIDKWNFAIFVKEMTWRWPVFFFKDKISRICKRGYVTVYTDSTTSADF